MQTIFHVFRCLASLDSFVTHHLYCFTIKSQTSYRSVSTRTAFISPHADCTVPTVSTRTAFISPHADCTVPTVSTRTAYISSRAGCTVPTVSTRTAYISSRAGCTVPTVSIHVLPTSHLVLTAQYQLSVYTCCLHLTSC